MAIDASIPLQGNTVDTAAPLNNFADQLRSTQLQNYGIQRQQVQDQNSATVQKSELKTNAADQALKAQQLISEQMSNMNARQVNQVRNAVIGAVQLKPFLDKGDTAGALNFLQTGDHHADMEDVNGAIQMIKGGQLDQLKQHVNGLLAAGSVLGVNQGYNLNAGETRFDASGQPVASNSMFGSPSTGAQAAPQQGAPAAGAAPTQGQNDQYLQTLPPELQTIVKGLTAGSINPATFSRNPQMKAQVTAAALQYDPNYTENKYSTIQEFTRGKTSQNIKAIETALNTLSQAKDASDALGGVDHAGPLNSTANGIATWYNEKSNSPELATYNNLVKNAADETTKAVTGGLGGVEDRKTRENNFAADQAPQARSAAINAAVTELMKRLDPIVQQYNTGTRGQSNGLDLLSPEAQAAYSKLTGQAPPNQHAGNAAPAAPVAGGWNQTSSGVKYKVVQ